MLRPVLATETFPLYRAEQVRELDRRAIQEHGIAGYTLMCRAGQAALTTLQQHWPAAKTIVIVCGAGNNGGDGYVLARLAQQLGLQASILTLCDLTRLRGDAATAWQDARDAGVPIYTFDTTHLTQAHLTQADVIVDAILGTGLQRAVSGDWANAIQQINNLATAKLALDIPSGLHADTGQVLGCAVRAELTVTFIGIKQGLLTANGPDYCGRLLYDDLAAPAAVFENLTPACKHYGGDTLARWLPRRARASHKGRHGHVLVIGGDLGLGGAARMAAEAAARCGAGLVSIATRPEHAGLQAAARPELMFHGIESPAQLQPLLERANVLAIGPGLGARDWGRQLLDSTLEHARNKPLVLDADALNLLATPSGRAQSGRAQSGRTQSRRNEQWILTPHPGEAARLLATDTASIQADRFAAVQALQQRYGSVVVLKGAGSLITDGTAIYLCSAGNPGMGTGGMGDVLTGVIASLLGQGLPLFTAARLGVYLHASAGDLAAHDGERGLLATDLLPLLRRLVNPGQ